MTARGTKDFSHVDNSMALAAAQIELSGIPQETMPRA